MSLAGEGISLFLGARISFLSMQGWPYLLTAVSGMDAGGVTKLQNKTPAIGPKKYVRTN